MKMGLPDWMPNFIIIYHGDFSISIKIYIFLKISMLFLLTQGWLRIWGILMEWDYLRVLLEALISEIVATSYIMQPLI